MDKSSEEEAEGALNSAKEAHRNSDAWIEPSNFFSSSNVPLN
jgi:hypothetical protein